MRYIRSNPDMTVDVEEEEEESNVHPDVAQALAKREQREATAKALTHVATKSGLKTAVKVGSSTIGIGEVLGAAEAAPVVVKEIKKTMQRQKKGRDEAWAALKKLRVLEAAKIAGKTAIGANIDAATTLAKGATAFFTSKELAEKIPSRANPMRYVPARRNPISELDRLLGYLLQLRTLYLFKHWNSKTYAEHLQYERIYQTLDADIDTLAELAALDQGSVSWTAPSITDAVDGEKVIQRLAQDILSTKPHPSLDNYLMTLIENRQRVLYLLRLKG